MHLRIDRNASEPLVQQIVAGSAAGSAAIASAPARGFRRYASWPGKTKLSQSSVIEAYDRLVALGMLESRHGSGFFVAEAPTAATELDSEWHEGAENAWGQFSGSSTKLKLGCG